MFTLPHHRLRFHFQVETPICLPGYKGSPWRGLFGHCLKNVVSPFKRPHCHDCLIRLHCYYIQLFETPAAMIPQKLDNGTDCLPHPLILTPPLDRRSTIPAGDHFSAELTLLPPVFNLFPFLFLTFQQMGQRGIGHPPGQFNLTAVEVLTERQWQALYPTDQNMLAELPAPSPLRLPTTPPTTLTLQLITPVRLKQKGRFTNHLPFTTLLQGLLRRLQQLATLYTPGQELSSINNFDLLDQAQHIRCEQQELYWFDIKRFSSRQQTSMSLGGLLGNICYTGNFGHFLPWLILGEALHVGGGTSFGFGKYELRESA